MTKEPAELRIKPLPPPPELQKISFRLPAPTVTELDTYLAAYAAIYGVEPDRNFVADQIFTCFFESDKAFAAYRKKAVLGINAVLGETELEADSMKRDATPKAGRETKDGSARGES